MALAILKVQLDERNFILYTQKDFSNIASPWINGTKSKHDHVKPDSKINWQLLLESSCPSAQPEPEGNRPSFPSIAFKRTFDVLTELQGTRKG